MKRIFLILAAVIAAILFTACANEKAAEPKEPEVTEAALPEAKAAAEESTEISLPEETKEEETTPASTETETETETVTATETETETQTEAAAEETTAEQTLPALPEETAYVPEIADDMGCVNDGLTW